MLWCHLKLKVIVLYTLILKSINYTNGIERVWKIITNNKDYNWIFDLEMVKMMEGENSFIEYSKNRFKKI
ncbi:hypothetical protein Ccar_09575 [Clostridium carboxidivorans P7]|uniref:Uncharacterized protein n=1 Tax=Clostridium carboxidivorans P7 TaxID=536227 RepID=C6PPZ5_9CLOT|nr:hypothetical protein Ccar_09575 [Clostridium carboxidivorans P7]EET88736.1 hypothetical protein CcarbDRAFT_0862 [Clostridium carboxidivorans P7]